VQYYWAKKSCRGIPILMALFEMCFFSLLFALDMQRLWVVALYVSLCILFGPLLFIFHTYCYEQVAVPVYARTSLIFYRPCKPTEKGGKVNAAVEEKVDLRQRHPLTDPIILSRKPGDLLPPRPISAARVNNPLLIQTPRAGGPAALTSTEFLPTSSQELYNWITDRNFANVTEVENVLFKKNV